MKREHLLFTAIASVCFASALVSCVICDQNICIQEGYRWCMNAAGAKGTSANGVIVDIVTDDQALIRGCDCLTPAENTLIDADKNGEVDDQPLDPNTEYFSVLDGIRFEARKRCFDRAKELQIKPEQTNCHAVTEGYFLGAGDGEPGFVDTCALDKYEAPCPDADDATKTSSTKGDKPAPPPPPEPEPTGGPSQKPETDPTASSQEPAQE